MLCFYNYFKSNVFTVYEVCARLENLEYTILCFPTKDRPPANIWKKIDQSRDYKNGNQLREYQLEGLNWLLFNWYNRYVVYQQKKS